MTLMTVELASILTATILITAVLIFLVYVMRQLAYPDKPSHVYPPAIEIIAIPLIFLLVKTPEYWVYQLIATWLTATAVWLRTVKTTVSEEAK